MSALLIAATLLAAQTGAPGDEPQFSGLNQSHCAADASDQSYASTNSVIGLWLKDNPIQYGPDDFLNPQPLFDRVQALSGSVCATPAAGNETSLCNLRDRARMMLRASRDERFALERVDGGPLLSFDPGTGNPLSLGQSREVAAAALAVFRPGPTVYRIRCIAPEPADTSSGSRDDDEEGWRLAGTSAALLKDRADGDFAMLNWSGDREAGSDTYSFRMALGSPSFWTREPNENRVTSFTHRASLSYERSTSSATDSSDKNIVGLGLVGEAIVYGAWGGGDRLFDYELTYLTDDQFEPETVYAAARTSLPFAWANGFGSYADLNSDSDRVWQFRWTADAVLDGFHVADAAGLVKLEDQTEYARLGANLGLTLRRVTDINDDDSSVWQFDARYDIREGLTGEGGEAQLFRSSFGFQPSKTGLYTLALEYERGEHLTSFTDIEKWTFGIGVRY